MTLTDLAMMYPACLADRLPAIAVIAAMVPPRVDRGSAERHGGDQRSCGQPEKLLRHGHHSVMIGGSLPPAAETASPMELFHGDNDPQQVN